MAKRTRILPGMVLELPAGGRNGYLLYLGKHPTYGEVVMGARGLRSTRPTSFEDVFSDAIVMLYPAAHGVRLGLANLLLDVRISCPDVPRVFRREGAPDGKGGVATWIIAAEDGERVVTKLTTKERQLPVAEYFSHDLVLERLDSRSD